MAGEEPRRRWTVRTVLPLRRPAALRLLEATAAVDEVGVAAQDGRVDLDAAVRCRVSYVGTDHAVRTREQVVRFRRPLAGPPAAGAPGEGGEAGAGEPSPPRLTVLAVESDLRCRPGRPYGDAVELAVTLEAAPVPGAAAAGMGTPATALLQVEELVGEAAEEVLETAEVLLDLAAFKVIDVQGQVADVRSQAVGEAVLVEGRLWEQIFYVAEDGLIHYQHAEIPFQRAVPLPAGPGMAARAVVQVRSLECELTQDGRLLSQKIHLRLEAKAVRPLELEVVTAAAPGLEVIREPVRVDRVVGFASARVVEERSGRLPTPAAEIVKVAAVVEEVRPQVLRGQVLVEGTVRQQVFYTCGGTSYHADDELPFHCVLDLPAAAPGMQVQAEAWVEEAEARLGEDGRQVERRVLVAVGARVTEPVTMEVVTAVGAGAEADSRRLRLERLVGQTAAQVMLQKKIPLVSRALGIVRVVGTVRDLSCEVIPDQVIVQGVLHQQVFYIDRQRVERYQTEDLPFTHLVDLRGTLPGMAAQVQARVKHLGHALGPDGNSFVEKAVVELGVRVTEAREVEVVTALRPAGPGGASAEEAAGLQGVLYFPWPYAAAVLQVRPALVPDGALRVHAFYAGRNKVVYHASADYPAPAGRRPLTIRGFRWAPLPGKEGRWDGVRWEAVLGCASP